MLAVERRENNSFGLTALQSAAKLQLDHLNISPTVLLSQFHPGSFPMHQQISVNWRERTRIRALFDIQVLFGLTLTISAVMSNCIQMQPRIHQVVQE